MSVGNNLKKVDFSSLHVSKNNNHQTMDNGKDKYEKSVTEKIDQLKAFLICRNTSPNECDWDFTMNSIATTNFLKPDVLNKILSIQNFKKEDEYKIRNLNLIHLYKKLKKLYGNKKTESSAQEVNNLIMLVVERQTELNKCFWTIMKTLNESTVSPSANPSPEDAVKSKKIFNEKVYFCGTWRRILNRTIKYLVDPESCEKLVGAINLIKPSLAIEPHPLVLLKTRAFALIPQADQIAGLYPKPPPKDEDLTFETSDTESFSPQQMMSVSLDGLMETLNETTLRDYTTKSIKQIYESFSLISLVLDKELEKKLCDRIALSTKKTSEQELLSFRRLCFKQYLARLTALDVAGIQEKNNRTYEQLKKVLHFFGKKYSQEDLTKVEWDSMCDSVNTLELPNLEKELFSIFHQYKRSQRLKISSIYDFFSWIDLSSLYKPWLGSESDETHWRGDKYYIKMNGIKKWIESNEKWITKNLMRTDNPRVLADKLKELFDDIKKMELNPISKNPSKAEIQSYNEKMSEYKIQFEKTLNRILLDKDCIDAFIRYNKIGKEAGGGCVAVLRGLCLHLFTGINMVPFTIKLMNNSLDLGLATLAGRKTDALSKIGLGNNIVEENGDTCYRPFTYKKRYPNPLEMGFEADIIYKAVMTLPDELKWHLLSLPRFNFLDLFIRRVKTDSNTQNVESANIHTELLQKVESQTEELKKVTTLRIANLTNSMGNIKPQFEAAFGGDTKVLLCGFQDRSFVDEKTQALLGLNSQTGNATVVTFPTENSSFFMQKGKKYGDPLKDVPRYSNETFFINDIMQTIIPNNQGDKVDPSDQYGFPKWYLSDPNFVTMIKTCCNNTYDVFFSNILALTEKERRIYIILFNIVLTFELIKYSNVDYFSFLSKKKTPITSIYETLLLKLLLIKFDKENEPVDPSLPLITWNSMITALFDGLPVTEEGKTESLYSRLKEVLDFLKDEKLRARLQNSDFFDIVDFKFPFAKEEKKDIQGLISKEEQQNENMQKLTIEEIQNPDAELNLTKKSAQNRIPNPQEKSPENEKGE